MPREERDEGGTSPRALAGDAGRVRKTRDRGARRRAGAGGRQARVPVHEPQREPDVVSRAADGIARPPSCRNVRGLHGPYAGRGRAGGACGCSRRPGRRDPRRRRRLGDGRGQDPQGMPSARYPHAGGDVRPDGAVRRGRRRNGGARPRRHPDDPVRCGVHDLRRAPGCGCRQQGHPRRSGHGAGRRRARRERVERDAGLADALGGDPGGSTIASKPIARRTRHPSGTRSPSRGCVCSPRRSRPSGGTRPT